MIKDKFDELLDSIEKEKKNLKSNIPIAVKFLQIYRR